MLSRLIRMKWPIPVIVLAVVAAVVVFALTSSGQDDGSLVVYNGRSHYGDEAAFAEFTERTGIEITLRGGTAPELFERLRNEGDDSPADLLVTTDLANLWRASEAGLLQPVFTDTLSTNVPEGLHDPDGTWWAITTRLRVPVVSTERVEPGRVKGYEDLADPEFRGRVCLRTSQNEYNQSFVADRIAKYGLDATRELLQSWMDNDPEIINSDGEILGAMDGGECDIGLVNHYYLARRLKDDPDFPVAPAWPDQDGAGAHANVSGVGVVASSDMTEEATRLMEFLTEEWSQAEIASRGEFPVNPAVPPAEHIADWDDVVIDPIDVEHAGPLLEEAIELMLEVGWT